jgi:hypothetical protein
MADKGKLQAALADLPAYKKGPTCGIAIALTKLEGPDQDEFLAALRDPAISSRNLCAAVKSAYGMNLQYATIIRHRAGNCQCHG